LGEWGVNGKGGEGYLRLLSLLDQSGQGRHGPMQKGMRFFGGRGKAESATKPQSVNLFWRGILRHEKASLGEWRRLREV